MSDKSKKNSLIIGIIFLLLVFSGFFSPWLPAKTTLENSVGKILREKVICRKLDNGITLLMSQRGFTPTLALEVSFKVGSVDETYQTIGAAHMLEHMLFKGTEKLGTKDFSKEKLILDKIQEIGEKIDRLKLKKDFAEEVVKMKQQLGQLQEEAAKLVISAPYDKIYTEHGAVGFNASTSRDKTGYYVQLPSSCLELWAEIESARLKKPVFREYYLERQNVIQERLMRYDSKGFGGLYERFLAQAFMAHPYRHPSIGWGSNIPYLSLAKIKSFYQKNYIPSRMVITIVGQHDPEKTYQIVKKYFAGLEAKPDPAGIAIKEPFFKGERRFVYKFEANSDLMIGWLKPTAPSREDYVFDLVSEILSGGRSSRFFKSLVTRKKAASSVNCWNGSPGARYDNLFVIHATPVANYSLKKLEQDIYQEINQFLEELNQEEIKKVINGLETSLISNLETNKKVSSLLSYYQTVFQDWEYLVTYLDVLKTITVSEIKKTVKQYFIQDNRVVGQLVDIRRNLKGEVK